MELNCGTIYSNNLVEYNSKLCGSEFYSVRQKASLRALCWEVVFRYLRQSYRQIE